MKNLKFFKPALFVVAMGLLIFLGFSRIKFESPFVRFTAKPNGFLFLHISSLSSFFVELSKIRSLAVENISLREENTRLLSRIAFQLQMEEENKSLREALNLPMLSGFKVIEAGIFNVNFSPEGNYLLINKGLPDGIKKDSSVISSAGVFVGRVLEVFEAYSIVGAITDTNFKTTIKILETNVSGIARGSLQDGVFIDFISQGEEVKEGDMVITDGNDLSPTGLIIGRVSHVSVEDGNVFKKVQVKPMMNSTNISKVMVLIK